MDTHLSVLKCPGWPNNFHANTFMFTNISCISWRQRRIISARSGTCVWLLLYSAFLGTLTTNKTILICFKICKTSHFWKLFLGIAEMNWCPLLWLRLYSVELNRAMQLFVICYQGKTKWNNCRLAPKTPDYHLVWAVNRLLDTLKHNFHFRLMKTLIHTSLYWSQMWAYLLRRRTCSDLSPIFSESNTPFMNAPFCI